MLSNGANGSADIHMAAQGCSPEPTFSQQINATQYVQNTTQAVARYADPSEAMAAGYVAVSPTDYPVVYYVNPAIVAANAAAKRTLDPDPIDGLVYAQTPAGTEVLAAAMYILPTTVASPPCLTVPWCSGISAPMCAGRLTPRRSTSRAQSPSPRVACPCPSGSSVQSTPYCHHGVAGCPSTADHLPCPHPIFKSWRARNNASRVHCEVDINGKLPEAGALNAETSQETRSTSIQGRARSCPRRARP